MTHASNPVLPHLQCDSKCLSLPRTLWTPEGLLRCTGTSWSKQDHHGSPANLTARTLQMYLLSSHKTSCPSIPEDHQEIPSTTLLLRWLFFLELVFHQITNTLPFAHLCCHADSIYRLRSYLRLILLSVSHHMLYQFYSSF